MKYLKEFATQQEYEAYINGNPDLPNVSLIDNESVKYNEYVDYSKQYLTFVALEDGTFKLSGFTVNYSLDGGETWTSLASNTNTPTIHTGEKIMWKGNLNGGAISGSGTFVSTGRFSVEGNVMSLRYGSNFIGKTGINRYQFTKLFRNCTGLINAKKMVLPTISFSYNSVYYIMFQGCSSLTAAPELPATELSDGCYNGMFKGCTSLTTAPDLPATTLKGTCYYQMFNGCSNLNYIKMLATNTSAGDCLTNWVSGVSPTGTFVKAASQTSLPTGENGIPSGWTVQNI